MPVTNPYWLSPTQLLSAAHFLQLFRTTLKAAGWTSQGGGDGLSAYSATSADLVFTKFQPWVAGANGFGQALAWERLREPGGGREIVWQYGALISTVGQWRVKISPAAKFSGGSPSATRVPSAADEFVLAGGGTDASPTYDRFSSATTTYPLASCKLVGMVDQSAPYGVWFAALGPAGQAPQQFYFHDPILNGSSSDTDLMVYNASNGISSVIATIQQLTSSEAGSPPGPKGQLVGVATGVPALYSPLVMRDFANIAPLTRVLGASIADAKVFSPPVLYGRRFDLAGPNGYKGTSSLFHWATTNLQYGSLLTNTSSYDRIVIGDVIAEWGGYYFAN